MGQLRKCGDLLEIEIYYNKKHLFLVELRFLDLSDEKCRDFLFSGGDFLFSADDLLEIEIYYNKKHLFLVELRFLDLGSGISLAGLEILLQELLYLAQISWIQINLML